MDNKFEPPATPGLGTYSRREFVRRSAIVAGAGVAGSFAFDLSAYAAAGAAGLASGADTGYKALVCVFLYGGNDVHNTYVPYDSDNYATYADFRGSGPTNLAHPRSSLLPLTNPGTPASGRQLGFTSQWAGLKGLYDRGDLAVVANVGTLRQPLTKAEYPNPVLRPPQLFSHNDQQSVWQSSKPEGATTGWGGRLADLMLDGNQNTTFTCISAAGNAVMMTGEEALQFHVDPVGVTELNRSRFSTDAPTAGIESILRLQQPGIFPSSFSTVTRRALDTSAQLADALDAVGPARASFPGSRLGKQLAIVSRLIAAGRQEFGMKRQVFFVAAGGFDVHDSLDSRHPQLLSGLNQSLMAFNSAMTAMGAHGEVTTFTASDFGRTLSVNGNGSDHGWGSHHIVMGGAVRGGKIYGKIPLMADDGPDDVGNGRLLPTTAVDQYAATLARWMGTGGSELNAVIPNIGRFDSSDLGFMESAPVLTQPTGSNLVSGASTVPGIIAAADFNNASHAEVLRLYQAIFARYPDVAGAKYWIDINNQGHDVLAIARYMSGSTEWSNLYAGTSDEEFVERVYENVLGRRYDQAGYLYWLNLVKTGQLDRPGMVFYVTANDEFIRAYPFTK